MRTIVHEFVADFEFATNVKVGEEALRLSKGSAPDYATYKESCGFRRGLEAGIALAKEMLRSREGIEDAADSGLGELPTLDREAA